MTYMPHILAFSLALGFISEIFPTKTSGQTITVTSCSGGFVTIDLGPNPSPPIPPHKLKPCHAICCSDEKEGGIFSDED